MRAMWTLPWPSKTVNHTYRVRRGRVYMAEEALTWKVTAANYIRERACLVPESTPLAVTIYQSPPRGWHGDADNILKIALDALALGLRFNDYWIAELHTFRGACSGDPHIDVILEPCRWRSLDEIRTTPNLNR